MNISIHGFCKVVSGNKNFVTLIFNICGLKMRFFEISQIFISEKSIFGHFEVIFLNVYIFPRAGVVFSCYYIQIEIFYWKEELSSWSQQKVIFFPQKYRFWPFLTTWVHIQSRLSQRTGKFSKNPWNFC